MMFKQNTKHKANIFVKERQSNKLLFIYQLVVGNIINFKLIEKLSRSNLQRQFVLENIAYIYISISQGMIDLTKPHFEYIILCFKTIKCSYAKVTQNVVQ